MAYECSNKHLTSLVRGFHFEPDLEAFNYFVLVQGDTPDQWFSANAGQCFLWFNAYGEALYSNDEKKSAIHECSVGGLRRAKIQLISRPGTQKIRNVDTGMERLITYYQLPKHCGPKK